MTAFTLTRDSSLDRIESPFAGLTQMLPADLQPAIEARDDLEATNEHLQLTIKRLQRLVYIDELTGLANRRYFGAALAAEIRRAVRDRASLSLFICDIDHFKHHNDTFGHRGGDAILRVIAGILQRFCRRAGDCAARYGGEEFALILPNLAEKDAMDLAEELRRSVAELTISQRDSEDIRPVTISIGVTTFYSSQLHDGAELVDVADTALYEAKEAGRNRTQFRAFRATKNSASPS